MRGARVLLVGLLLSASQGAAANLQDPQTEPDRPLGRGAAFGRLDSGPTARVTAGTPLRSRPSPEAAVLTTIEIDVELQVLESRGDWVRTAFEDWIGWVAPGGEQGASIPGYDALRTSPLVIDTSPAERAARIFGARSLLVNENREARSIGGWPLHTDIHDAELLDLLDRVAGSLPAVYGARFGLTLQPSVDPPPVVIFASEEQYRAFTAEHTDLGALHGGGHADDSMAALFAGDGSTSTVAATLVHELTHLLNRRVFAGVPSTWLEEGLANDLGSARIATNGDLAAGTLGGESSIITQRTSSRRFIVNTTQSGGLAMWTDLVRNWRQDRSRLIPIPRLLDMPWIQFVAPEQRASNYALSTFLVRFLLDVRGPETATAFRGFLAHVARGGDSDSAALAGALGTTPEQLRREFERWLTVQAVAAR